MSLDSEAEALAFINAMRLTIEGRVGFKWMVERLNDLAAYLESLHAEADRLNAFIDATDARADYEAFRAAQPDAATAERAALSESGTESGEDSGE